MKNIMCFFLLIIGNLTAQAQAPKGFNFQGIAVDSAGYIVASKPVSLRFTITLDSLGVNSAYQEIITSQTDKYGQFTVSIGTGTKVSGNFDLIPWGTGNIFLKTEIDIKNNAQYVTTGFAQLLSVPFALYANNADIKYFKLDTLKRNLSISDSVLTNNTTGIDNVAVGYASQSKNTTGRLNTSLGNYALNNNTTGSNNIAVGAGALMKNTTGNVNTAMGVNALYFNTTGAYNNAYGNSALYANTTGTQNTSIGYNSMYSNTTGYQNTAVGFRSLYQNTTGFYNTGVGVSSLLVNTTGQFNTAIGWSALMSNTTGNENTSVGQHSMAGNTTGNYNTAIGRLAGYSNKTASRNSALGYGTLFYNVNGESNTAVGIVALQNDTSSFNTAVGDWSLGFTKAGSGNTAIGYYSGSALDSGNNNIFIGMNAGNSPLLKNISNKLIIQNDTTSKALIYGEFDTKKLTINGDLAVTGKISGAAEILTDAYANTKVGTSALLNPKPITTTGNVAVGDSALKYSTGLDNTAIGSMSLLKNINGSSNTAIGGSSLLQNTTGVANTAIGQLALKQNTTGGDNTASGVASLYSTTTGSNNTASGHGSLFSNTTGAYNTASGLASLKSNTTGKYNTALGVYAGGKLITGDNNIFIGNAAGNNNNFTGTSNKLVIQNDSSLTPLVYGEFDTKKLAINGKLTVGVSSVASSSAILEASSTSQGFLPPRMTDLQKKAIKSPAQGLIVYCTNCGGGRGQAQIFDGTDWTNLIGGPALVAPILAFGDSYLGGIVFYVDSTGGHGLIAAASDQGGGGGGGWGCYCSVITGLDSTLGSGQNNTTAIVNQCANVGIAAKVCDALVLNGYSDWYLPSKLELDLMYSNLKLKNMGNFLTNVPYWSSTSASYGSCGVTGGAWTKNFGTGVNIADTRSGYSGTGAIRAIRSF